MPNNLYIVFVEPDEFAEFEPDPFVNEVVARFDFICAYGIKAEKDKLEKLENLKCISAISIHTNVICTENQAFNAFGLKFNSQFTGKGVTVAVIDSGIFNHLDFVMPVNRIKVFKDFINSKQEPYDDNGHGTAVAGVIGGNGISSGKKIRGTADECDLIVLKAIKENGEGSAFDILEAMQWIYENHSKYNIQVVCMSFGAPPLANKDPLVIGAEALWDEGIAVVASAGNNGPKMKTILSPGCSAKIITVGGAEIENEMLRVPDFSSRGPVDDASKPDIVAPATDIDCCNYKGGYVKYSGTSFAAPFVAGICALIKSKRPEYTPDKIKELLLENAVEFCGDKNVCGSGLINIDFLSSDF